ncbi:MAG: MBOAT family protein, partial [Bacteroidales bacterium]|nr:MBOAT family protein [Bacteroidales bacterium]
MDFLENLASLFVYNPDEPLIFSSGSFLVLFLAFIIIYAGIKERKVLTSVFVVAFSLFFYYKSSGLHVI